MTELEDTSDYVMDDDDPLFKIFAKFQLSLDSVTNEIDRKKAIEQLQLRNLPRSFVLPYTIPLDGNGRGMVTVGGPTPGREWIVREITAVDSTYTTTQTTGNANTGAAGAATSVSLAGPALITGISVSFGVATAAGQATITLSGVQGGPYTWYVEESTTAAVTFNQSLDVTTNGTATLSVSAVASGGIVAVNIFGTTGANDSDVTFYSGQNINQGVNTPLPQHMAFARMHGTPDEIKYTSDVVRIVQNQQIIVGVMGSTPNGTINGMVKILDQPAFAERLRVASQ